MTDNNENMNLPSNDPEYFKTYYKNKKNEIHAKVQCIECGHIYMKNNKSNHLKTKKHSNGILLKQLAKLTGDLEKIKAGLKA